MCRKLFVIGTGFDKSHGLDTLYQDFYEYLKSEYSEADEYNTIVPDATIDHHGNEIFDKNEVVGYLLNVYYGKNVPLFRRNGYRNIMVS